MQELLSRFFAFYRYISQEFFPFATDLLFFAKLLFLDFEYAKW